MRHRSQAMLIVFTIISAKMSINALGSDSSNADLMREILPKFKVLKDSLVNVEITGTLNTEYSSKSKILNSSQTKFRYLTSNGSELIETQEKSANHSLKVIGINPAYSMSLTGDVSKKNYRLDHLSGKTKKKEVFVETMDANSTKYFHSMYGWSRAQDFYNLFQEKGFVVKQIAKKMEGDIEVLKVEFDYTAQDSKQNLVMGGWMEFDMKRSFALRKSLLKLKGGSRMECFIEYLDGDDKMIRARNITWKTTCSGERADDILSETMQID